jgi:eukaryotic-like serine/threonine-protein kinase
MERQNELIKVNRMFCTKCGKVNPDKNKFCNKCGNVFLAVETIQPKIRIAQPTVSVGQILEGKYRLNRKIATDRIGDTYESTRIQFGDTVAVKILHQHLSANKEVVERFKNEAQIGFQLKNNNVPKFYDIGFSTSFRLPFLVTELPKGQTIRKLLNENKVLPLELAVAVSTQTCAALAEAHQLGIIHRNIKPENIISTQTPTGWVIKILNFGLAKVDLSSTETIPYLSPEHLLDNEVCGQSDIYSLAVIICEILCGVIFSPDKLQIVAISPEIKVVLFRALNKKPADRQNSAATFASEFIQAVSQSLQPKQKPIEQISVTETISAPIIYPKIEMPIEIETPIEVETPANINDFSSLEEVPSDTEPTDKAGQIAFNESDIENLLDTLSASTDDSETSQSVKKNDDLNNLFAQETEPKKAESKVESVESPKLEVTRFNATDNNEVKKPENSEVENLYPIFEEHLEQKSNNKTFIFGGAILAGVIFSMIGFSTWYFSETTPIGEKQTEEKQTGANDSLNIPAGMVSIPGGEFMMGNNKGDEFEKPAVKTSVKPFYIDIYEVTCADYKKFIDAANYKQPQTWKGRDIPTGWEKRPVTGVNWDDASAYAKWMEKRLPTEAEWEFAARGTDGRIYPWGNDWQENMANANNAGKEMKDVGSYQGKSPFGIYDMVGNAWEWTADDAKSYGNGKSIQILVGISSPKVIRGGNYQSKKTEATVTYRGFWGARDATDYKSSGFRCVKD